jgi:NitT/TauT family transport system substrate-binding protein
MLQVAADSPYKSGADLNGKIMATAALNDLSQLSISAWVDKNGGDSKTLKFVEIPNTATDEALVQHRIAAANLLEPLLDASIAAGHTKTIGDPNGAISPKFMFAAYVGRADWAKEHSDLLRRFVRVAGQAATYTNAHTAETASMMSEITKIPLPIMQRMKRVACATTLDSRMVQPLIDAAVKYKTIAQAFPAKDLFFEVE